MRTIRQSRKLMNVRYDVRGPILVEAQRLEAEGHKILKLNIGNPGAFGFRAPEHLQRAIADLDVPITLVTGAIDERLNEHGYIVPGLGDAGDRLYGVV